MNNQRLPRVFLLGFLIVSLFSLMIPRSEAIVVCPGIYYVVGTENYTVIACMTFGSITVNPANIAFNSTYFNITCGNPLYITMRFLADNILTTVATGYTVLSFDVNTLVGAFNINLSGFKTVENYDIYINGVFSTSTITDTSGRLQFSHNSGAVDTYQIRTHTPSGGGGVVPPPIINGSHLLDDPYNTTFFTFIRALGQGWIIIPFAFIGAALFMKTRDTALVSLYLVMIGAFIGAGSLWAGFAGAALLFFILAALGFAALMYNVFYGGR